MSSSIGLCTELSSICAEPLGSWQDPITLEHHAANVPALQLGFQRFELDTFLMFIRSADLNIDIDIASENEFVLTALNDRFYNLNERHEVNPLRLRNPVTNCPFSDLDLQYIWRNISLLSADNLRR